VNRVYKTFPVNDIVILKQQMLSWANSYNICCFFDNKQYTSNLHSYECLVAVGAVDVFKPTSNFLSSLSNFYSTTKDWIFGHFNYDLKSQIDIESATTHVDHIGFPECFLFVPQILIKATPSEIQIGVIDDDPDDVLMRILSTREADLQIQEIQLQPKITRDRYVETINKLLNHLKRGDCYEINYCQEFYAQASINPLAVYKRLTSISPNPFSAYYKVDDKYLLSSSPERYLKKTGNKLISQPIKGTAARNNETEIDNYNKHQLLKSQKERSENVMVVDLVRNDLSKVCIEGTVKVDELFGIYSFPGVHQMISTVSGDLKPDVDIADILKATFPMGSMTGAPKKKVMELIEKYETTKRGIYSGALGYISPQKDFDFSVVIRSIMYNDIIKYVSYQVGSGITYYCDPQQEYEECLLKATAMNKVFDKKNAS